MRGIRGIFKHIFGMTVLLALLFAPTRAPGQGAEMVVDAPSMAVRAINIVEIAATASNMLAVVEKAFEYINFIGKIKDNIDKLRQGFCALTSLPALKLATVIVHGESDLIGLSGQGLTKPSHSSYDKAVASTYDVVMAAVTKVNLKEGFSEEQVMELSHNIVNWVNNGEKGLFNKIRDYIGNSECNFHGDIASLTPSALDLRRINLGRQGARNMFFSIRCDTSRLTSEDLRQEEIERAARTKGLITFTYETARKELSKMGSSVYGGDAFTQLLERAKDGSDDLQNELMTNTSAWLLIYNQVAQLAGYASLELMMDVLFETNSYNSLCRDGAL